MDQVSQGALRLPEIQRAYVWKPAQVAGLIDSLYRRYPSGSILLWETTETVTEKEMSTLTFNSPVFVTKPLYLLDGQQRLTSLHRVFTGHEKARVVFNVLTEKFQIESAATKKDKRWVQVDEILRGTVDTYTLVDDLSPSLPDLPKAKLFERLDRIRRIGDYSYYLEILDDLPYPEVTQVFVRVNSRGRALKDTDLAVATLSARWPGVVKKMDELIEECRARRYNSLDAAFIVRAFAAIATDNASPSGFGNADIDRLDTSWPKLQRGVRHTIDLLTAEVGLDNTTLLPSVNALVPLVYYLGVRPDAPLSADERNALVYWLLVSFIQGRYSASATSVIAQDVTALRATTAFEALFSNLGLLGQKVEIAASSLVGKGSTSPYFLLSYLVARRNGARDWWYGSPMALSHDGTYKVEYHHIHPRARLAAKYGKAEINDLANLAFISDKANRKISARPPAAYFAELEALDPSYLPGHFVPTDPGLRSVEEYPALVGQRRESLAAAMSALLESYRPSFLVASGGVQVPVSQSTLSIEAYGTSLEADDIELVFDARLDLTRGLEMITYVALDSLLDDLSDGRGGELEVGRQYLAFDAGTENIEIPVGPLLVSGSIVDWRKVLDREVEGLQPLDQLPAIEPLAWEAERQEFSVLDSE